MADGGGINIRLSLKGAEQVRAELDRIGPSGAKMARELDRAMRTPTLGMKALDAGAREARSGVDALAGRTGGLGTMLSALGPWGLAAAAGLAAVALAATALANQTRGAMTFADEIDDAANKINIGTEALQEYRFAMTEAGGSIEDADAALDGFQKKFGEASAGGRSLKWFTKLGLDPKDFATTQDALDAVIRKLSGLGSEAERAALAEKLGLAPMIPLIRQGGDAIDDLRQKARDLGVVMDAELIRRGAQANQEFETLAKVIDIQLKSAFIDLAPALVAAIGLIAQLATALADALDQWKALDAKTARGLRAEDQRLAGEQNALVGVAAPGALRGQVVQARRVEGGSYSEVRGRQGDVLLSRPPVMPSGRYDPTMPFFANVLGPGIARVDAREHFDAINARRAAIATELGDRSDRQNPVVRTPTTTLVDTSTPAGGRSAPVDREPERRRRAAEQALERLLSDEVDARRAQVQSVADRLGTAEAQATAARALLDLDREEQVAALAKVRKTIEDGGLMTEQVEARLAVIAAVEAEVDAAQRVVIAREEAADLAQRRLDIEEIHSRVTLELLTIASSEARTADERRAIEGQLLEISQRRMKAELEAAISAEQDAETKAALVAQLAELPRLFAAQRAGMERQNANPVRHWQDNQRRSAGEVSEFLQGQTLDALDGVNRGLIDAWRNAEGAGDAFRKMGDVAVEALGRVLDALLEVAIQRLLIEPAVNAIFGEQGGGKGGGSGGSPFMNFLNQFASNLFGGGQGTAGAKGGKAAPAPPGKARGGIHSAAGEVLLGEFGIERVQLPIGSRIYDTDRTQQTMLDMDNRLRMRAETGAGASSINMPVTIVNQTSAPVAATTRQQPGGGMEVILREMFKGQIQKAGVDGSLEKALRSSPRPIKR